MNRWYALVALLLGCSPSVEGSKTPAPQPPAPRRADTAPTTSPPPSTTASAAPAPSPSPERSLDEEGEPPPGVPAPLYASLFEANRAWTLSGTTKSSRYDDRPRNSKGVFKATCRVSAVKRLKWGVLSQISCENMPSIPATDPLTGTWIAFADGLIHLGAEPQQRSIDLTRQHLVLRAVPSASVEEEKEADTGHGLRRTVSAKGASWCFEETSWGGDEGWEGICIDPATGFTSGQWGWAGGSSQEAEFFATRAK